MFFLWFDKKNFQLFLSFKRYFKKKSIYILMLLALNAIKKVKRIANVTDIIIVDLVKILLS